MRRKEKDFTENSIANIDNNLPEIGKRYRCYDELHDCWVYSDSGEACFEFLPKTGKWKVTYIREKTISRSGIEMDAPTIEEIDNPQVEEI